jgi:hypothetical protein
MYFRGGAGRQAEGVINDRGVDRTRASRTDPDAERLQLDARRLRQSDH